MKRITLESAAMSSQGRVSSPTRKRPRRSNSESSSVSSSSVSSSASSSVSSSSSSSKSSSSASSSSQLEEVLSPVILLKQLLPPENFPVVAKHSSPSIEELENYDMESVQAVKTDNLQRLGELLEKGKSFRACNRNGETLLHLACRQSKVETVTFLCDKAHVPMDAVDSLGRTVLHDALWRPLAEVDLLEALLPRVPIQLFGQKDSRGHVCFDYARRTHWAAWVDFLKEHRDFLLIQAAKLKKEDDTGSAEKGTTYKIVG